VAFFSCGSVMQESGCIHRGLVADADAAAGLADSVTHHVHADATRAAFTDGGEAGAEEIRPGECLRTSMVAATSAVEHALAHGLGANLLVVESASVVLHAELVAVGAGAPEIARPPCPISGLSPTARSAGVSRPWP
jgi:hypothetical protein